jgi:hypothetical protein
MLSNFSSVLLSSVFMAACPFDKTTLNTGNQPARNCGLSLQSVTWTHALGRTVISPRAVPALDSEELRQGPGLCQPAEGTYLAVDTCRMARKSEPPKWIRWNVYKISGKAVWLGEVGAVDKAAAIEKTQGTGHEADGVIRKRPHHVALPAEKVRDAMNRQVIFCTPVSYRRRRSPTPCAALTATSWCSASPSRKTRRPLPSVSVGSGCRRVAGGDRENTRATERVFARRVPRRSTSAHVGRASRHFTRQWRNWGGPRDATFRSKLAYPARVRKGRV